MAFAMPQVPPELLALLSRGNPQGQAAPLNGRPGVSLPQQQAPGPLPMTNPPAAPPATTPAPAPIRMGPGGKNLAPDNPATPPGATIPGSPTPMVPGNPADIMKGAFGAPKPPQSSDDPGITGMPALPTPPDNSNNPVMGAYKRYQDLEKQRAAIPLPDAQKLKPKWYDRLEGAGVGFASGWGNAERGAQLGGAVTTRRFDNANAQYGRQTSALDKQMEAERGGAGMAEAAAKIPQTDFENKMQVTKEGREQKTGQSRIDQSEARAARLQDQIDNPPHKSPKNADEALSALSEATDPVEKARLAKLVGDLHAQEIDRVKSARPPKADKIEDPSGLKPDEQREINSRTIRSKDAVKQLHAERAGLVGSTNDDDKSRLTAIDKELDKEYGNISAVEDEVLSRRGTGEGAADGARTRRTAQEVGANVNAALGSIPKPSNPITDNTEETSPDKKAPDAAPVKPVDTLKSKQGNNLHVGDVVHHKTLGDLKITKLYNNGKFDYTEVPQSK